MFPTFTISHWVLFRYAPTAIQQKNVRLWYSKEATQKRKKEIASRVGTPATRPLWSLMPLNNAYISLDQMSLNYPIYMNLTLTFF